LANTSSDMGFGPPPRHSDWESRDIRKLPEPPQPPEWTPMVTLNFSRLIGREMDACAAKRRSNVCENSINAAKPPRCPSSQPDTWNQIHEKALQPCRLQGLESGTPEETRTPNLLIRSQTLYPIELRVLCRASRRGREESRSERGVSRNSMRELEGKAAAPATRTICLQKPTPGRWFPHPVAHGAALSRPDWHRVHSLPPAPHACAVGISPRASARFMTWRDLHGCDSFAS
jgi:hypothetical protein